MIYVRAVLELLRSGADVRGLAHITGGGLLNLLRLHADVGFEISDPLPAPPVFGLVRELGDVAEPEMWEVFNMGCGFAVVVPEADEAAAVELLARHHPGTRRIGTITAEPDRITVPPLGIAGGPTASGRRSPRQSGCPGRVVVRGAVGIVAELTAEVELRGVHVLVVLAAVVVQLAGGAGHAFVGLALSHCSLGALDVVAELLGALLHVAELALELVGLGLVVLLPRARSSPATYPAGARSVVARGLVLGLRALGELLAQIVGLVGAALGDCCSAASSASFGAAPPAGPLDLLEPQLLGRRIRHGLRLPARDRDLFAPFSAGRRGPGQMLEAQAR